jgi:UDP-galactopyranose mutase (EC 5.4.99.9)
MYDYLIVGAGLFGAVFAYRAKKMGLNVLVIDKREHIGGNCYTDNVNGILVHKYGAHIFHTSNKEVWMFVNQFAEFNHYRNSPIANYRGRLYNLPFNMNTFYQLWGVKTPEEALAKIEEQRKEFQHIVNPTNLEEQALVLTGKDIYEKLIKGYSEKQWGMRATEIPAFVITRLPFRFIFDNNYFNDTYQGIPIGGYTKMIEKMLSGVEVKLGIDYLSDRSNLRTLARKVLYTGQIDAYFDFCFGKLDYRSLQFEHQYLEEIDNYQGNAVINYTEYKVPYTRIIEHKHFEFGQQKGTVITKEYSCDYNDMIEPFYPINDTKNQLLYERYNELTKKEDGVRFGGRLGEYKYYDMHKIIERVLNLDI